MSLEVAGEQALGWGHNNDAMVRLIVVKGAQ